MRVEKCYLLGKISFGVTTAPGWRLCILEILQNTRSMRDYTCFSRREEWERQFCAEWWSERIICSAASATLLSGCAWLVHHINSTSYNAPHPPPLTCAAPADGFREAAVIVTRGAGNITFFAGWSLLHDTTECSYMMDLTWSPPLNMTGQSTMSREVHCNQDKTGYFRRVIRPPRKSDAAGEF